jgi:catechol 2,3-dioxygenase-like lactoylglutathione lyase family enzyme
MKHNYQLHVTGIDHIYVAVSDLHRSELFYDKVMRFLDFRKGTGEVDGEPFIHYYNPHFQFTLRQAKSATVHDPLAPGLNHLCFQVQAAADVDGAARGLKSLGISITEPRFYPEYTPDYYAIYFSDPDGVRLEIVSRTRLRDIIRERWHELDTFENPLQNIGAI